MNPRDINDYAPFAKANPNRLLRISKQYNQDLELFPGGRLYFISEKLKLDPKLVAQYFSTHLFILEKDANIVLENLEIMLEHSIDSMAILRDLWAFKYTPNTIRTRLERAKGSHHQKLMPWMARCPEVVLERSLDISQTHNEIIGVDKTVADYFAKRLGYDIETAKGIVLRHPQVKKMRLKKAKEMIDYLLDEKHFEPFQIARYPKILCHKLETVQERMKILEEIDCKLLTLAVLCRSQREFEKFINEWNFIRNRRKEKVDNGS